MLTCSDCNTHLQTFQDWNRKELNANAMMICPSCLALYEVTLPNELDEYERRLLAESLFNEITIVLDDDDPYYRNAFD